MRGIATILSVLFVSPALPAGYWVSTNGNNSNPGTQASPWLTVAKAASSLQTNDVVHVTAGTYDERVTPSNSGDAGRYIIYKGEGATIRGFDFTGKSNWQVVGFHFFHPDTTYFYDAIFCPHSQNWKILDNNFDSIHAIHASVSCGQSGGAQNFCNNGLVRSNIFYRSGLAGTNTVPIVNISLGGTNNLIEYNDISYGDDFTRLFGTQSVIRNNYMHDTADTNYSNAPHVDGMQTFPTTNQLPAFYRNMMEANMMVRNSGSNGHLFILQNDMASNVWYMAEFIIRGNVNAHGGDTCGFADDVPAVRVVNNTITDIGTANGTRNAQDNCIEASTNYAGAGTIQPTNFCAKDNIFYHACLTNTGTIFASTTTNFAPNIDHNLSYLSGPKIYGTTGSGTLTNVDPVVVNYAADDLHLQVSSPAIAAGGSLTTTVGAGTAATVVTLLDPGYFTDGWGMVDVAGDTITVGTNPAVVITSINYANGQVAVATPISWQTGNGVYWGSTNAPDMGAFPYKAGGYVYSVAMASPAANATVSGTVTLSATVVNAAVVRFVKFYADGLEVGSASAAPYTASWTVPSTNIHTLQARAYPLYADSNLASVDQVVVNPGTFRSSLSGPATLSGPFKLSN